MPFISLRITSQEDLPEKLFKNTKTICCKEKAGTPKQHYHAICDISNIDTMRSRLKKYYKGNEQFSCKLASKDYETLQKQIRYVLKGLKDTLPDVQINTMDVNVEASWKQCWLEYDALQKEQTDKEKQKKKKRVDIKEEIQRLFISLRTSPTYGGSQNMSALLRDYLRIMMCVCEENGRQSFSDYVCIQHFEDLCYKYRLCNIVDHRTLRLYRRHYHIDV